MIRGEHPSKASILIPIFVLVYVSDARLTSGWLIFHLLSLIKFIVIFHYFVGVGINKNR